MQTRLTHVRANVSNLSEAVHWFSEVLRFKVRNSWPPDEPGYVEFESKEGAMFSIMVAVPVHSGGWFSFSVEDVEALWDRLKDQVEIVEPLFDIPSVSRKFTIQDLDGNELGFVEG